MLRDGNRTKYNVPDAGMIYQQKYHKQQKHKFLYFESSVMEENGHL
jgi:hypothetical protein